jgi:ubiquinone/menaquinone biosynthesis C-methylase UbiE
MQEYEDLIEPTKRRLFSQLAPVDPFAAALEVVEVGSGTGPNLPYYPGATRITAVDPNHYMLPFLRANAERLGWQEGSVQSVNGVAEALPLPDASADAVVMTLVLCSVPDVAGALREAARVLRPGGRLLFIEHTAAPEVGALALAQWALDPLQQWLADGCHLRRDPLPALETAGFARVVAERFTVPSMGLIAPHIAGMATL